MPELTKQEYADGADSLASKLYSNLYSYKIGKLLNHPNLNAKTNSAVDIGDLVSKCVDETIRQAGGGSPKDSKAADETNDQAGSDSPEISKFEEWFADDFGQLVKMAPQLAREQLIIMSTEFVQLCSQLGDFAKTTKCLGKAIQSTDKIVRVGRWSAFCLGLVQAAFGAIMLSDWKSLNTEEKISAIASCAYGLFSSAQDLSQIRDIEILTSVTRHYGEEEESGAFLRVSRRTFVNKHGNIIGTSREMSRERLLSGHTEGAGVAPLKESLLNRKCLQKIFTATDIALQSFNILVLGLFAAVQVMTVIDDYKKCKESAGGNKAAEVSYVVLEGFSALALAGSAIIESMELVGGLLDWAEHNARWLAMLPVVGGIFSMLTMMFQIGAMIAHIQYSGSNQLKAFAEHAAASCAAKLPSPPEGWKPPEAGLAQRP
jgi:hypothetical protein